ncbi:MAG TPA: DUF1428 family protein [Nitrososphaera sp.]|jgi:uncharacterized protein YbaA (DUF1428 family)|nr:DUF1428 family protein [Thermoproteota archaeon]HEU0143826.1 DUF1428 family protein [Nitrososphaera sp.]
MENKIDSTMEIEGTGNFLQHFLYRVPKKNHDALIQNLKQFVPWFKKHGARVEYYQLGRSETKTAIDSAKQSGMDVMDSIDKILSTTTAAEDEEKEEVWIEQQYFRDYKHCEEVYSKMMQDKSIEPLGSEFFRLITQGKKMITGGFNRLRT